MCVLGNRRKQRVRSQWSLNARPWIPVGSSPITSSTTREVFRPFTTSPTWKSFLLQVFHVPLPSLVCLGWSRPVERPLSDSRDSSHSGNPGPSDQRAAVTPITLYQKMSCSLPPEIVDLIIDHLHDEPATLKACCLVSKSWIQRTRIHLFVDIKFHPLGRRVSRWRETFPDRTNSPAHHTRTLSICHPQLITAADVHTLLTFCGVLQLTVDTDLWHDQRVSLVPLRGFPVLRSLHLTLTSLPDSEIFGLVCSLPLLEDLALVSRNRRRANGGWNIPPTSPRLTGSLELRMIEGIGSTTRRLLDLPNGLHFTKIAVPWFSGGDILSTMYLVSRCSGTLESLDITNHLSSVFHLAPRVRFSSYSHT